MRLFTRPFLAILWIAIFFVQCKEDVPEPPKESDKPLQTFPIRYKATLPNGKLPYPHHNPEISQQEYETLVQELFIINNFGLYQCGDTDGSCYFHDGLDMVYPNGTPIFAVDSGIVRANIGGNNYYRSLIVEDALNPGFGWSYTHIYNFAVGPGETVSQGQYLAEVNFQGLEHIHLSRIKLREGGTWEEYGGFSNIYPDDHFVLVDENPPIIEKPFQFYHNESDLRIQNGTPDTVSGQIDIVVRMRDIAQFSGDWIDGGSYWGDRLAVKKIKYRILRDGQEIRAKNSFDFSQLEFYFDQEKSSRALTVFQFHEVVYPDRAPDFFNRFASPYIITNANPDTKEIDPLDGQQAWDTEAIDEQNQPIFPNGLYEIEVSAFDTHDNLTVEVDSVYVRN